MKRNIFIKTTQATWIEKTITINISPFIKTIAKIAMEEPELERERETRQKQKLIQHTMQNKVWHILVQVLRFAIVALQTAYKLLRVPSIPFYRIVQYGLKMTQLSMKRIGIFDELAFLSISCLRHCTIEVHCERSYSSECIMHNQECTAMKRKTFISLEIKMWCLMLSRARILMML